MEKIKHLLLLVLVLFSLSIRFGDIVSEKVAKTENESAVIPVSDDAGTCFFTESALPVNSVERPITTGQTTVIIRQLSNFSLYCELKQNLFTKIKSIHTTFISYYVSSLRSSYGLLVFGLMKIRV
jgi:hypothetical protein